MKKLLNSFFLLFFPDEQNPNSKENLIISIIGVVLLLILFISVTFFK